MGGGVVSGGDVAGGEVSGGEVTGGVVTGGVVAGGAAGRTLAPPPPPPPQPDSASAMATASAKALGGVRTATVIRPGAYTPRNASMYWSPLVAQSCRKNLPLTSSQKYGTLCEMLTRVCRLALAASGDLVRPTQR